MHSTLLDSFRNRFCLVAGGSSEIGFAVARELLEQDAKIVIIGLHGTTVESAVTRLGGRGPRLDGYARDIGAAKDVELTAAAMIPRAVHPDFKDAALPRIGPIYN